ncbi:hypothetical protein GLAREA_02351 [Glarea lozoyensis ATCC 20868]|uniref:Uncharacterized protein n=1 Tax=Glarea lozoyensis (strain ATCC 20868 / MF5171) TaxID=1116229 RepID=S3DIQ7_GLAL2|nr:uncharacterized protein GLAREA_02351 [Glarea lozoyensis ATCC 20868]EPE26438.1 hypothetical protein GLAREA_02351 [Glarea lozoyensis ATCC 20868]
MSHPRLLHLSDTDLRFPSSKDHHGAFGSSAPSTRHGEKEPGSQSTVDKKRVSLQQRLPTRFDTAPPRCLASDVLKDRGAELVADERGTMVADGRGGLDQPASDARQRLPGSPPTV